MLAPETTEPQPITLAQFVKRAFYLLERGYYPLPVGRRIEKRDGSVSYKAPWLSGWNGYDRRIPDQATVLGWPDAVAAEQAKGKQGVLSLGIVLPPNVLGVDVDDYGYKHGLQTLANWADQFGVELPATWIITARPGGSGIRLYRNENSDYYPKEVKGSDIEFLDSNHRYAMAPGSWHHTGATYRLYGPDGKPCKQFPTPDQLPAFPSQYESGLPSNLFGHEAGSASDVEDFLSKHTAASRPGTLKGVETLWRSYLDSVDAHEALKQAGSMGFNDAAAGLLNAKTVYDTLKSLWRETGRGRAEFEDFIRWQVVHSEHNDHTVTITKAGRDYDKPMSTTESNDDSWADGEATEPWERYPLTSARTLAAPIKPVRWLVQGVWPERSAGAIAGKKKTFKTWQMHSLAGAVSTGLSYLDRFPVTTPGPVLYLTGEGGQVEFQSRHQAIMKRYSMTAQDMQDVPFHAMFDVAPLDDADFLDALRHHLDAVQPVLTVIDPLYAYHPSGMDSSNLYERGQMLAQIRSEIEPYAALIIGDHINKSADDKNLDLDLIGYSGVSQWADSWSLQRHREQFSGTPTSSTAKLEVEFGSRRAGSMRYDIDWHLARDMSDPSVIKWASCNWTVLDHNSGGASNSAAKQQVSSADDAICELQNYVDEHPTANKTNIINGVRDMFDGFSRDQWRDLWDKAIRDENIIGTTVEVEKRYGKSKRLHSVTTFKRGAEVGKVAQR